MNNYDGFIIEYMINSPCNLSCPFCFGPDPKLNQSLSKDLKLKLIRNLKKNNVKKIIIAGGEPTLEEDIIDVCKLSNSLGIGISLQTNGFYLNVLRDLLEYIDFLALPLDGIHKQSQLKMRTSINHFENTTKALELVSSYNLTAKRRIKVKIGTVLSKFNIDEIDL